MSIDPRLQERRKAVAEDHAKRNVGRLLKFLIALFAIGALVWLALSPWMSVSQVRTAGISVSDGHQVLTAHRVVAGTPLILLRTDEVEEALRADPWVRDAWVRLEWPDEVIVRVEERIPLAWVETAEGWSRRDIDGVAVPSPAEPDHSLSWVQLSHLPVIEAADSRLVTGALEFVANLPSHYWETTTVRLEEGELWATVAEYEIRLGRPIEMAAKALSLVALLREEIPQDSILVLVAPTHPAIRPATATAAGEEEDQAVRSEEGEAP